MANYCIMNLQKMKTGDFFGKQAEANRAYNDVQKYHGNVDLTKSANNIYLVKSDNWLADAEQLIEQAKIKRVRSDAVKGISIVFDASPEWMNSATPAEINSYFYDCLDFAKKHFGNVINAVIHMDETKPHMHISTVPIIYANNGNRLSAKDIIGGKAQMSKLQDEFFEQVGKKYELERGKNRMNNSTQKKRLSELEYQTLKETEKLENLEKEIIEDEHIYSTLNANIQELRKYFLDLKIIKYIKENHSELYRMVKNEFEKTQKFLVSRNIERTR